MKRTLIDRLLASFNSDPFKTADANSATGKRTFEAIHFSWYNRHCTQGHSAPADIPPALLSRAGCTQTNHGQFLLYMSRDMEDHQTVYQSLKSVFADVFGWIDDQLQMFLPGEYERLEAMAAILPGNNVSVVSPFVGLVVNLNVVTRAHRDSKDDGVCLVLPIGEFDGGELCLVEPGLIIPLRHGEFAVFPSCDFTHFNMHYTGTHASIVLQSDREMCKWTADDRNGWVSSNHFR
ncbi:uncharacterized protein B0H18DRAFT_892829 [Fomitopsis serialis]|uniref:uncharacterized protein n=1 Tax=Fomitopsis serialis TaxID=139415 RepID=UPI002008A396|nr:uncharacterized protein B0H18DRAFT_892829 [Neoantrodia serialis]KAH9911423.1 hypothetical protein B0H18DRAFT_892829 [Neoantrodia serialis]